MLLIKSFLLFILIALFFITKKDRAYGVIFILAQIFIMPEHLMVFCPFIKSVQFIYMQIMMLFFMTIINKKSRRNLINTLLQYRALLFFYFSVHVILFMFPTIVPYRYQILRCGVDVLIWLLILTSWSLLNNETYLKIFVRTLAICVFINLLYAVFTTIVEFNIFGDMMFTVLYPNEATNKLLSEGGISERLGGIYRTLSTFGSHLTFGQTMILTVPFFIYFKKYISSWLYVFLMILIPVIVFLSSARSAIIPLVFVYILFLLFYVKKKYLFFGFILAFFGYFSLIIFNHSENKIVNQIVSQAMFWDKKKQDEMGGSSFEMRQNQVQAIFKEWDLANPLTGLGRGYREYYQDTKGGMHPQLLGFESILLLKPVERGLIGIIAYLLLLSFLFFHYYSKQRGRNKIILLSLFTLFVLSGILTGERTYSFLLLLVFGNLMYKFPITKNKQPIQS